MDFWEAIEAQLEQVATATTADEVIAVFQPPSSGDGFFAGSGGDRDLEGVLSAAGWSHAWREAAYYWAMIPPGGDRRQGITYVEGDLYKGIRQPLV